MAIRNEAADFAIYERMPTGILVYRVTDRFEILYVNQRLAEMFECDSKEQLCHLIGDDFANMIYEEDVEDICHLVEVAKKNQIEKKHHIQYRISTYSGDARVVDDIGEVREHPQYGQVVVSSITFSVNQEYQESKDQLTKSLRMHNFYHLCEEMILQEEQEDAPYSFIFFNIRNFKNYNLQYGMDAGDEVLIDVAQMIGKNSSTNIVSRFSGDHFVSLADAEDVVERCLRIQKAFRDKYEGTGMQLKTGIYPYTKQGLSIPVACDLAKAACDSIYQSASGIKIYDHQLEKRMSLGGHIIQAIDEAIEHQYIKVYYQPVIRTLTGALCGMEALARWIDPVYGFLSPGDFIPILEENRLITKLDLYVLREVCRQIREHVDAGFQVVPVSFNLSRQDFLACDIFEEVEQTVHQYGIARDMIHLEVTESIVMEEPDVLMREIRRFRDAGYEVWMDDFGSGYSSLNVLKEYEFDEIKLDMLFMRSFDEKTKKVVKSIISMAKALGMKTLAEGVETEEQVDFLREIGCGKVQGYYYSKPIPMEEVIRSYHIEEFPIETRGWHGYYDKVDEINFITDQPLAIMNYDGQKNQFIYVNDAYKKVWESLGSSDLDQIYENINSSSSPMHRKFQEFQQRLLETDGFGEMEYTIHGQYVRLRARTIARKGDQFIGQVEIANLRVNELKEQNDNRQFLMHQMCQMFDSIYVLRPKEHHYDAIIAGSLAKYASMIDGSAANRYDPQRIAELVIHPEDRESFLNFVDQETILDRIQLSSRDYVVNVFRTKNENGSYQWKSHSIMYVPGMHAFIYCTKLAVVSKERLIQSVLPEFKASHPDDATRIVWKNLMSSKTMNMFWKNTERQFMGANEKFLETYGFTNIFEILGKTDEEMMWHPDNGPYRDDEWRVLKEGVAVVNRPGKCIIKGKVHNIMATKEPLYQNGRIIGLFGTFIDLDELSETIGVVTKEENTDSMTGLMSAQGMIKCLEDYMESWELRREKFAIITVSFAEYQRAVATYGDEGARTIIRSIANLFSTEAANVLVAARIYGGSFVLLAKYQDKSEIKMIVDKIHSQSRMVTELDGYKVTLDPEVKAFYAEEVEDIREMFFLVSEGMTAMRAKTRGITAYE